jgi:putative phosphoribosyl transferase
MFADRADAGDQLAEALRGDVPDPAVVLGIPRGGVIVAARVARLLGAPLDVVVARKLGAPGNPELAVGAVADGVAVVDWRACRRLGIDPAALEGEIDRQQTEVVRRTAVYRQGRPQPALAERTAVVVDDGVATGWTCVAAARRCRRLAAASVLLAVPVGPGDLSRRVGGDVDRVVCLTAPRPYLAVGQAYRQFGQVDDQEVLRALEDAATPSG